MTRRRRVTGRAPRGFVLVVVLVWLGLLASLALGVALVTMYEPMTGAARARAGAVAPRGRVGGHAGARSTWPRVSTGARCRPPARPRRSPTAGLASAARWPHRRSRRRDVAAHLRARDAVRRGGDDGHDRGPAVGRPQPAVAALRAPAAGAARRPRPAAGCRCYLVAWIADDPADADGDPAADAPPGVDGHGVLLVRGAAFAAGGAVAEVEALVGAAVPRFRARCAPGFACSPGARWARAFLDPSKRRGVPSR